MSLTKSSLVTKLVRKGEDVFDKTSLLNHFDRKYEDALSKIKIAD